MGACAYCGRTHQRRIRVRIRAELNLRPFMALAVLGLALTCASLPARAQQWTPQQRAACESAELIRCRETAASRLTPPTDACNFGMPQTGQALMSSREL